MKTHRKNIWLILGAGISKESPANIPVWNDIKKGTIKDILEVLSEANSRLWHTPPNNFQFDETSSELQRLIQMPESVLESMCNIYLEWNIKDKLGQIINSTNSRPLPNQCHRYIAKLTSAKKVKGIITPNFDSLLEQALNDEQIPFQIILPSTKSIDASLFPIFKVHGTIDNPETLSFLNSTYLRGLPKYIIDYFENNIKDSTIIICGYSGNDVDLYPVVKSISVSHDNGNDVILVKRSGINEGSPFAELKDRITEIKSTGTSFFAELLGVGKPVDLENDSVIKSSLLPHKDPFECAMFAADALININEYNRALNYFYLAEDIAEDSNYHCGRGIATIGRSLCLFGLRSNQWAVSEMEKGRSMLEPIDLDNIESRLGPIGESRRISLWIMRSRHLLGLTSLALSLKTTDINEKKDLIDIAKLHCHTLRLNNLGRFPDQIEVYLNLKVKIMNLLIEAYSDFLDGNNSYTKKFYDCIELSRNEGWSQELFAALITLSEIAPNLSKQFIRLKEETAKNIGVGVQNNILSIFENPGDPFTFRHMQWRM